MLILQYLSTLQKIDLRKFLNKEGVINKAFRYENISENMDFKLIGYYYLFLAIHS